MLGYKLVVEGVGEKTNGIFLVCDDCKFSQARVQDLILSSLPYGELSRLGLPLCIPCVCLNMFMFMNRKEHVNRDGWLTQTPNLINRNLYQQGAILQKQRTRLQSHLVVFIAVLCSMDSDSQYISTPLIGGALLCLSLSITSQHSHLLVLA